MTRKDFELIASVLRDARSDFLMKRDAEMVAIIAARFANRLNGANPNFDRERFLRACKDASQ